MCERNISGQNKYYISIFDVTITNRERILINGNAIETLVKSNRHIS